MSTRQRHGVATTEMAFCLPIIIFLMLGVIETCTVIFLKESVALSAYEGARVGIRKQGTNAEATARVQEFLDSRGVTYTSNFLTISSPGYDNADDLDLVTLTVVVPCQGNTYTGWIFGGRSVSASVTMRKDFANTE